MMQEGSVLLLVLIFGTAIVLISAAWLYVDYRKGKKLIAKATDEKAELISIIADAELMMDELNNFQEYLITRIEEKNNELGDAIKELPGNKPTIRDSYVEKQSGFKLSRKKWRVFNSSSGADARIPRNGSINKRLESLKSGKNVSEVLELAKEGMDEFLIARELGIGRGEVNLVLGLFRRVETDIKE